MYYVYEPRAFYLLIIQCGWNGNDAPWHGQIHPKSAPMEKLCRCCYLLEERKKCKKTEFESQFGWSAWPCCSDQSHSIILYKEQRGKRKDIALWTGAHVYAIIIMCIYRTFFRVKAHPRIRFNNALIRVSVTSLSTCPPTYQPTNSKRKLPKKKPTNISHIYFVSQPSDPGAERVPSKMGAIQPLCSVFIPDQTRPEPMHNTHNAVQRDAFIGLNPMRLLLWRIASRHAAWLFGKTGVFIISYWQSNCIRFGLVFMLGCASFRHPSRSRLMVKPWSKRLCL